MKQKESIVANLIALAFLIPLVFVLSLVNGWVVMKLWGWHVAPTFGVQRLGIVQAAGLGTLVAYFHSGRSFQSQEELDESVVKKLARGFIVTGSFLLIGYILACFR